MDRIQKMKTQFILRNTKYQNTITQVRKNENTIKTNLPSDSSLRLLQISLDQISSYGQNTKMKNNLNLGTPNIKIRLHK